MEMWENAVHEWVQDSYLQVLHVPGRINPADIFTKEINHNNKQENKYIIR